MGTFPKILVPVDLGEFSASTIEHALGMAQALGGSVLVFHVIERKARRFGTGAADGRAAAEEELRALLEEHPAPDVSVTLRVTYGSAPAAILQEAADEGSDMIIMGTRSRASSPDSGPHLAPFGNVTEHVVRRSPVPVLTVPLPDAGRRSAPDRSRGPRRVSHREEEVLTAAGVIAGAATGAIAGPPGIVAGTVIGATVGMAVGKVMDEEEDRIELHDEDLDEEIGVTDGAIGARPPDQPPARFGAYSAGSAGAGRETVTPSEGPLQHIDKD